jgi:aminotransferase EvaB
VITAANTCVPTIVGIEGSGASPVLVDVDQDTFTLDPRAVDSAVTSRTRAVVPVHLYGQCADMDQIAACARRHRLKIVEDAAQAHGATYRGRRAGTLADAAAFSFYPTKNLGAFGHAGAVVTDNPETAEQVRRLRSFGESERNRSVSPRGANSQLDTIQAAILLTKLALLDGWNERRRTLARLYRDGLSDSAARLPIERQDRVHVYHLFVIRVPKRDQLRARLFASGIETLVHYPLPVHSHHAYRDLAHVGLDVSEQVAREVLSLPLYPDIRDDEVDLVVHAILRAL